MLFVWKSVRGLLCSCRSSRSPWSHTQACIYQKTLSCNHFLRVKGKRAVKPKLWLAMSISHWLPIAGQDLEYSLQLSHLNRTVQFMSHTGSLCFSSFSFTWLPYAFPPLCSLIACFIVPGLCVKCFRYSSYGFFLFLSFILFLNAFPLNSVPVFIPPPNPSFVLSLLLTKLCSCGLAGAAMMPFIQ